MSDLPLALEAQKPGTVPFDALLRRLDPDRDAAAEKYESLRRKLLKFFEWNGCFPAEDLVDQTFDRLASKISSDVVEDVGAFAWGVAKKLRHEALRQAARVVPLDDRLLQTDASRGHGVEADIDAKLLNERRLRCLDTCLKGLGARDRSLFLTYHGFGAKPSRQREALAAREAMTIGALRVRMNRLREKLERCASRCLSSYKRWHAR